MLSPFEFMRRKKGYRQQDIETKTGIPQPRYSRIERGVAKPTDEEFSKIREVLLDETPKK